MNYTILLMLFVGVLTRAVDNYHDRKWRMPKLLVLALAVAYGLTIAFVAGEVPATMPLFLAVILGLIITGKIDYYGHFAGTAAFFAASYFFGFSSVNLMLFLIFLLTGILDEKISDYSGKRRTKLIYRILEHRPFLEIIALSASAYTGIWEIWISLFLYDIGAGYIPVYKLLDKKMI